MAGERGAQGACGAAPAAAAAGRPDGLTRGAMPGLLEGAGFSLCGSGAGGQPGTGDSNICAITAGPPRQVPLAARMCEG